MLPCSFCHNNFSSIKSLRSHKSRMHRELSVPKDWKQIQYDLHPMVCKICPNYISFENRKTGTFCSKKCALLYLSQNRPKHNKSKIKQMPKTNITRTGKAIPLYKTEKGPYCLIYHCKCQHCGVVFVNRYKQKYCNTHCSLYKQNNRNRYQFTFNCFKYPDLFDIEMLKTVGFYQSGRRGIYNLEGITRDHKISVNEAIRNNYDPYYIKHPINCELMSFSDNTRKKTKSSINYDQLVIDVVAYDNGTQ